MLLPIRRCQLEVLNDRFGARGHAAELFGDDLLLASRGFLQLPGKDGQFFAAMPPPFDFFVAFVDSTHGRLAFFRNN